MRNEAGDGIICDYCKDEYSKDFTYYSLDFYEVHKFNMTHSVGGLVSSYDMCQKCMDAFKSRVKELYSYARPDKVICEITGQIVELQEYKYYKCKITKVNVSLSNQPWKCIKTGSIINENDEAPEGKIQEANMDLDRDHLEIIFGFEAYKKFVEHVTYIKEKL